MRDPSNPFQDRSEIMRHDDTVKRLQANGDVLRYIEAQAAEIARLTASLAAANHANWVSTEEISVKNSRINELESTVRAILEVTKHRKGITFKNIADGARIALGMKG